MQRAKSNFPLCNFLLFVPIKRTLSDICFCLVLRDLNETSSALHFFFLWNFKNVLNGIKCTEKLKENTNKKVSNWPTIQEEKDDEERGQHQAVLPADSGIRNAGVPGLFRCGVWLCLSGVCAEGRWLFQSAVCECA